MDKEQNTYRVSFLKGNKNLQGMIDNKQTDGDHTGSQLVSLHSIRVSAKSLDDAVVVAEKIMKDRTDESVYFNYNVFQSPTKVSEDELIIQGIA